jgi:hypothetical protein
MLKTKSIIILLALVSFTTPLLRESFWCDAEGNTVTAATFTAAAFDLT